jgi:hypothetical protein
MYQRVSKEFYLKHGGDLGNLESIHYEVMQKCRSNLLEFEHRQALATADAQRMHNLKMI